MRVESTGVPVPAPQAPAPPSGPAEMPVRMTAHLPDQRALQSAVAAANAAVRTLSNSVEFSVDERTGRTVVRVVDADTGKLIRQLPSAEMLAIAQALDRLQGLLVREQA